MKTLLLDRVCSGIENTYLSRMHITIFLMYLMFIIYFIHPVPDVRERAQVIFAGKLLAIPK